MGQAPGNQKKENDLMSNRPGLILYVIVVVVSLWFLLWFGNYKGEFPEGQEPTHGSITQEQVEAKV